MEDQFTEEVKNRKEQGQSERQMAAELNVSRSKVDLLKEIKQLQLQVLELQASLRKDGGQSF